MKSITVILGLLAAASCVSSLAHDAWTLFKAEHGKSYENQQVESLRREIFARNKATIDKFNEEEADLQGYRLKINHLADWTEAEIRSLSGFRAPSERRLQASGGQDFLDKLLADDSIEVPDELDWRKTPGRVSQVKNQHHCGSCWAFSATGALEGQQVYRNMSKKLVELSQQNLLDCIENEGCGGGSMYDAFIYVQRNEGIDDDQSYPYQAMKDTCRYKEETKVMTDQGANILPSGDEKTLKEVVAKFGPVSIAIDSHSSLFHFYESGIYNNKNCTTDDLDHGVLVVGYGTDPKYGDYWLVKNSWGVEWGDHGYVKMTRNAGNQCGVATQPVIPTFAN